MGLVRRLGALDLTLITIGGIIGSGIFRNPAIVAGRLHVSGLVLGAWIAGGIIALIGAFTFAELGARRPETGGTYVYLRDAFHPVAAFMFGWSKLLVSDVGATAASAILFAGYLEPATGLHFDPKLTAFVTLAAIAAINMLGVRQGSNFQNLIVALKLGSIAALIVGGLLAHPSAAVLVHAAATTQNAPTIAVIGAALIPVLFAYTGFATPTVIAGEVRDPQRTIPLGLIAGVGTVILVYVLVNVGMLRVLGVNGLAASTAPAADVMQALMGPTGAHLIALAIAVSTLGYMSNSILVSPRIYFQMAADGNFFKQIAWVHPRTHAPIVAIALYGLVAAIIALSGTFEHVVNWATTIEYAFVVLAALALFRLRRIDAASGRASATFQAPGHPYTTALLVAALVAITITELIAYPFDTLLGAGVTALGAVVYFIWQRSTRG